ncbi:MAG: cupredoxin family protein [Betaproteobacteria bacterium]|nr:cupredoxin family protein [Betaproteobacteria bacterium]
MGIDLRLVLFGLAAVVPGGPALAHGEAHAASPKRASVAHEQTRFGIAGDPAKASRTVVVEMSDEMRFSPEALVVKRNETVRFVVRNSGSVMHEMVIGTAEELAEHAALMKRFPDMEHGAPHMAHVKPGASGEIVWNFNRAGTFEFACLAPGHFEAGMIGRVVVR